MQIEQFVMAYHAEQDRLRALLPDGFTSLRPVLRINAELRQSADGEMAYLEYNTAAESRGKRGWLNVGHWETDDGLTFERSGRTVTFTLPFLTIRFNGVGIAGGCPEEKDNDGCFFADGTGYTLHPAEVISANKEFCDCSFDWHYTAEDARGVSIGKTFPAFPTPPQRQYDRQPLSPETAAAIPCDQVLGAYKVCFQR